MENLLLIALFEHKDLLESQGYKIDCQIIDLLQKDGDFYKRGNILYEGKRVGNIGLENQNMYYFEEDGIIVGNKDISTIKFGTRKSKNVRTLIHTYINQGNLKINCFNMLHSIGRSDSEDRKYICITDKETVEITKFLDDDTVTVKSLIPDISDDSIINSLRKAKVGKRLSYTLGDVMDEHKD